MQTVTFASDYDHPTRQRAGKSPRRVTSYKANGGPNGDGTYEVSDATAEAAKEAGVLQEPESAGKKPAADKTPKPGAATPPVTDHADVRG